MTLNLENSSPYEIIEWGCGLYDRLCAAASFGKDSVVLLHMLKIIRPDTPVIFLNTSLAFPATLEFMAVLEKEWSLNIIKADPLLSLDDQNERYGGDLFQTDPGLCCSLRKVEPMSRVLKNYDAWMTGLRRDESPMRKDIGIVEETDGVVKINPLANWTETMVWDYIHSNKVPYHPLYDEGYRSLGCQPCTLAGRLGQFERAGRWSGTDREGGECGLHTGLKIEGRDGL